MRPLLPTAPLARAAVLGLAHALLLILAFPPVFLPLVALLIPLPALLATRIEEKPKRAALVFGLATAPAWVFFHRWLIDVTLAGYPFLVLILCLYATLFVLVARRAARVMPWWIAAPLAWTAVEFFRGQIAFDGYPWYLTAQPLVATWLALPLPTIGVYATGGLVALIASTLITRRFRVLIYGGAALLALLFVGALWSAYKWIGDVRVAVVQTNVPQDNKTGWTLEQRRSDFDRFIDLTRKAAASNPPPHLIVWPETMFPGLALDAESLATLEAANLTYADGTPLTYFSDRLLNVQLELGVPMLVGAIAYDDLRIERTPEGVSFEPGAEYNSAILIADGQPQPERYDKLQLTPFGEVMPYISWSDWLESKLLSIGAPGMAFSLKAGDRATVFELDLLGPTGVELTFRFATPICFEATMPGVCRRLTYGEDGRRVNALIQLTNDGWFGDYDGGRETHLLLAMCRATELGVPVIRAANTGISTSSEGSVPLRRDGVLHNVIPFQIGAGTIYGRYLGDALGWLALLGTFAGVLVSFRKKKTPPTSDPAPDPESDPAPETAA